ncbi:lipopolysaccharide export system permease protein [Litoreibacter ponti]|uniref:Lipopolysaccharide export system permease protein n=1 Tax=Litoreibacter ponti TaxID=1510457 RepID=A0A2T6BI11_9RHOB|nr:LPS export ABC transporter permease LptG [Litoreibacter ponti]PTX55692.1 lipopolysaccharide export system permease protein [Litoreibacter ponti]
MRLDLYFARRFVWSFTLVFGVFFGIVLLIDLVEQMRRFDSDQVGVFEAGQLALLNAPATMYRMLPLLVVLATITLFLGLARTSEMVVTRASGRSALRSLMAPVLTALFFGAVGVAVLNPIVAGTSKQFEVVSGRYASGGASVTSVSDEGLWLRQASAGGQVVIRAARSNLDGTRLFTVSFYGFDTFGKATYRVEAAEALLEPGQWVLSKAKRWTFTETENPETGAVAHPKLSIASDLTRDQIRDSFGDPSSIPIWELPRFIRQLERAGFSALQHRVWLNMELANPVLLAAMVLIGAGFTMRHTRFGRTGLMVLFAVLMGFGIFFLRNFAQVLGQNGQIPILVAAWAPPLAGIFMSLGLLFHTEDG